MHMNVLYLKEAETRKPDYIGYAVVEVLAQCDDIVHIATIQVDGLKKTVKSIRSLILQFNPEMIIAPKVLGSIVLFELPKSIRKIIINPYLILEDSADSIKLPFVLKYNNLRLYNWLIRVSIDFSKKPDEICGDKTYLLSLQKRDFADFTEMINYYHQAINKVRLHLDPNFELPKTDELLGH